MTGASDRPIQYEREERIGWITLNRPPLNILDIEAFDHLQAVVKELDGVDVLVFRSANPKAFSAGADIADHVPERAPAMLESFHRLVRRLWSIDAVTIASVQGVALGGGMELALCCDLVIAAEDARFGQPEIKVGCFPPVAAAVLPLRVGLPLAADFILTGRHVSAKEALSMGLVSRLAAQGSLEEETAALVSELVSNSGDVLRQSVRLLRHDRTAIFLKALERNEKAYVEDLLPLADAREGIEAFIEKRKPRWRQEKRK